MPISRPKRSSRSALVLAAGLLSLVVACDTSTSLGLNERMWGFVSISTIRNTAGEHRISPNGVFFLGQLNSIPNAAFKPDSCFPAIPYVPPSNSFTGVTFLDAGAALTTISGGRTDEIPRISSTASTTYDLPAGTTLAHQPGDSIVIQVPGATGGFPQAELRGRTAEPFTLLQPIEPSTANTMQLRWSPATDNNSALSLSFQYKASASAATQEIRCFFVDDGVDSIPLAEHAGWSAASNVSRAVVATRLRTVIMNAPNGGVLELISTYQVPTPQQ